MESTDILCDECIRLRSNAATQRFHDQAKAYVHKALHQYPELVMLLRDRLIRKADIISLTDAKVFEALLTFGFLRSYGNGYRKTPDFIAILRHAQATGALDKVLARTQAVAEASLGF